MEAHGKLESLDPNQVPLHGKMEKRVESLMKEISLKEGKEKDADDEIHLLSLEE